MVSLEHVQTRMHVHRVRYSALLCDRAWSREYQGRAPRGNGARRVCRSSPNCLERGEAVSLWKNQLGWEQLWEDPNVDAEKSGLFLVCQLTPENKSKCLNLSVPSCLPSTHMTASDEGQHSTHWLFKVVWNPQIKCSMLIKYHHECPKGPVPWFHISQLKLFYFFPSIVCLIRVARAIWMSFFLFCPWQLVFELGKW